jgi:anti-sigma B factor antagonist
MTDLLIESVDDPRGLRLAGELDLATVPDLDAALRPLAESGGEITMDVSALRFMDSSAVQLLIRTLQALDRRGRLYLVKPMASVRRLIEVMGLTRFENLEVRE